ncbi:MAG: GNAT family N-acetyltransferase [Verrucomicrobiae bacterium]|nr:GNAT family N-acetyltransferase [Verrucomicrobiae bacterium]
MAIETALERFPKKITTNGGLTATCRPLKPGDHAAFHEFFTALPAEELLHIKHRVTDHDVVKQWCEHIDLGHNLPLVALDGAKIVGVCTLHQNLGGWKRHIGRISSHAHPQYRGKGLGYKLVEQVIDIARQCGLQRLEAEFMGHQTQAMKLCAHLGFAELYRLEDYVKDMQAIEHDYVVMGLELITDEEYAGMG